MTVIDAVLLVLILVLAVLMAAFARRVAQVSELVTLRPALVSGPEIGSILPPVTAFVGGEQVAIDLAKRPPARLNLVAFLSDYCDDCKAELQKLTAFVAGFDAGGDHPHVVVLFDVSPDIPPMPGLTAGRFDAQQAVGTLRIVGFPTILAVDSNGRVLTTASSLDDLDGVLALAGQPRP